MSALPSAPAQVVFSSDVPNMNSWAHQTRIPLTTAEALGKTYARAHGMLKDIRNALMARHGWTVANSADPRMLMDIVCESPIRSSSGAPRTPPLRLQIPQQASSFFTPDRKLQWEMVFHSATFPALRNTVPPIADLLHLLQCLLTGMLLLVKEEMVPGTGLVKTARALPSASWMAANQARLVDIFGPSHYQLLFKAASNNAAAFKAEVIPERR
jgi:hypothetical protein